MSVTAFFVQSAGSTKDDKGKKGKKGGKGKDEPVRKSTSLKPAQKPRNAESAVKTAEEMVGREDTEERGEKAGPTEQEEKVRHT